MEGMAARGIDAGVAIVGNVHIAGERIVGVVHLAIAGGADRRAGDRIAAAEGRGGGLGGLGFSAVAAVVVGAGADDQADVFAVADGIAIQVTVEPAVRSIWFAVVTEADDQADVIAIDNTAQVDVSHQRRAVERFGVAEGRAADVYIVGAET